MTSSVTLAGQLAQGDAPRLGQTATVAAWSFRGGGLRWRVRNLEDGPRDDEARAQRVMLRMSAAWRGRRWTGWDGASFGDRKGELTFSLGARGSVLLRNN